MNHESTCTHHIHIALQTFVEVVYYYWTELCLSHPIAGPTSPPLHCVQGPISIQLIYPWHLRVQVKLVYFIICEKVVSCMISSDDIYEYVKKEKVCSPVPSLVLVLVLVPSRLRGSGSFGQFSFSTRHDHFHFLRLWVSEFESCIFLLLDLNLEIHYTYTRDPSALTSTRLLTTNY